MWDGIISKIIQERDAWYPICVKFDADGLKCVFTLDGRLTYDSEVVLFKIKELNMYEIKFKVGDRVKKIVEGIEYMGTISKIIRDPDFRYPICVKFDTDDREQWFTPDGSIDYNDEVVIFKIEECNMDKIKFKVGDKVRELCNNRTGTVTDVYPDSISQYPVFVRFDNDEDGTFTLGGYLFIDDSLPSLVKIEEPATQEPPCIFQMGDEVNWNGMLCTVVDIAACGDYPVIIADPDNIKASFTLDGRFRVHMTAPSITLITRAKKKVKPMPALLRVWGRKLLVISEEVFNTLAEAEEFYREYEFTLNTKDQQQKALIAWPYIPGVTEIEE